MPFSDNFRLWKTLWNLWKSSGFPQTNPGFALSGTGFRQGPSAHFIRHNSSVSVLRKQTSEKFSSSFLPKKFLNDPSKSFFAPLLSPGRKFFCEKPPKFFRYHPLLNGNTGITIFNTGGCQRRHGGRIGVRTNCSIIGENSVLRPPEPSQIKGHKPTAATAIKKNRRSRVWGKTLCPDTKRAWDETFLIPDSLYYGFVFPTTSSILHSSLMQVFLWSPTKQARCSQA